MVEDDEIDFSSPEFATAVANAKPVPEVEEMKFDTPVSETVTEVETPEKPVVEELVNTPATPEKPVMSVEPNYAEWLTTKTGGVFKTEEELIAALEKVKNYDTVELRAKELETKIPKFENEETEKWFNLVQSKEGKQLLKDYISESEKDYVIMSSVDVVKEILAKENPSWSKKDIDLEIRAEYGKQLEKLNVDGLEDEDLEKAEAHNERVEENLLRLERAARDGRIKLIDAQSKLTLPELKKAENTAAIPQFTPEQIADNKAKWQQKVEETVPKLENFKMNIDDKGVEYVWNEEEKAAQVAEMKNFNIFDWMKSEGWTNADNTWNPDKIAEGVRFLRDRSKIITSIAGQVKTDAIKATMAKIKGIDPNFVPTDISPKKYATLEEAAQAKIKEIRTKQSAVEYEEAD